MVNKVSVVLDVATEKGVAAIKGIRQSVSEADGAFGKLKAGGASAFDSIKANAALAGTAVVGAIAVMAAKSIQAASDLSESINAVNVTFGKSADGILKLGEAAAEAVGLSNSQFNGLAVQFSSFANTVAGEGGDVVGTIDDMTHRVADFASVMNIDVPRAGEVFQSALAGEQEGIKKFGIDMSAATVEQFAFANGIAKVGDQLTETQKVQARYGLLMQATEKVAGDFANTADGLANSQRILAAKTTDTAAKFGNALKPAMEAVVPVLIDTLDAAAELAPAFQAASDQVADVVKGAKPLVDALGLIASGAGDAAAGFEAVDEKTGNWLSKISGKVMTDALKNTLFGPIVGTGLQAKDMFDKLIGSTDKAAVSLDHLDERSYAYGAAVETVIVDLDHLDERHQTATSSTESHQIAIDNAAKASVDYKGALQDVADAMDEQIEATNALVGGDIAVRDAQREAAAAVAELTAAQGDQSLSADELSAAQDGAAESLIGAAQAAVDYDEKLLNASGETLTASEKQDAFKAKLGEVAATLAPGSALRTQLEAYIALLDSLPAAKTTTITAITNINHGKSSGNFAGGGTVPGPMGQPQLAVVHGGEEIWDPRSGKDNPHPNDVGGNTLNFYSSGPLTLADLSHAFAMLRLTR